MAYALLSPECIYALIDDIAQIFYIGRSANIALRFSTWKRYFRGVKQLSMVELKWVDDAVRARLAEIRTIQHYKAAGFPLVNINYAVAKTDKIELCRVQSMAWRYIGVEENARRYDEKMNSLRRASRALRAKKSR